jgi:hypothetical protein
MHEPGAIQFLTWRLADSLPASMMAELERLKKQKETSLELEIDKALGEGHGECVLKNPLAARILVDELMSHRVHSFVVMPNHVHTVVEIPKDKTLPKFMHGIKGRTAYHINKALGRKGVLWQREYFDRVVRGERELELVNRYIEWNPVKAKLVDDPREFTFSSALPSLKEKIEANLERRL